MAIKVDPFIYPIPEKFLTDPDPEVRAFFIYFQRWAHDMWRRTGGGRDEVANNNLREIYPWVTETPKPKTSFEWHVERPQELFYSEQSANYTSTDFEYINASGGITVDLPSDPAENSLVVVLNGDGSRITVDGNGKNVDFKSSIISVRKGTLLQLRYLVESDEWVIE